MDELIVTKYFEELKDKYGDGFCWLKIDAEKDSFVNEAYREITQGHPMHGIKLAVLAKSEITDDVLFCTEYGQFVVIHLTYCENNTSVFPKYKILDTHQELRTYLETKSKEWRLD